MKAFMRAAICAFLLSAATNTAFADIQCWPGIKVYGVGDNWICWTGFAADCLYCTEEVIVRV